MTLLPEKVIKEEKKEILIETINYSNTNLSLSYWDLCRFIWEDQSVVSRLLKNDNFNISLKKIESLQKKTDLFIFDNIKRLQKNITSFLNKYEKRKKQSL